MRPKTYSHFNKLDGCALSCSVLRGAAALNGMCRLSPDQHYVKFRKNATLALLLAVAICTDVGNISAASVCWPWMDSQFSVFQSVAVYCTVCLVVFHENCA